MAHKTGGHARRGGRLHSQTGQPLKVLILQGSGQRIIGGHIGKQWQKLQPSILIQFPNLPDGQLIAGQGIEGSGGIAETHLQPTLHLVPGAGFSGFMPGGHLGHMIRVHNTGFFSSQSTLFPLR